MYWIDRMKIKTCGRRAWLKLAFNGCLLLPISSCSSSSSCKSSHILLSRPFNYQSPSKPHSTRRFPTTSAACSPAAACATQIELAWGRVRRALSQAVAARLRAPHGGAAARRCDRRAARDSRSARSEVLLQPMHRPLAAGGRPVPLARPTCRSSAGAWPSCRSSAGRSWRCHSRSRPRWPAVVLDRDRAAGASWRGGSRSFATRARDSQRRRRHRRRPPTARSSTSPSSTHYDFFDGPAVRIGIFLSIFNVHINRAPRAGRVLAMHYKPGEFLDARNPESRDPQRVHVDRLRGRRTRRPWSEFNGPPSPHR